MDKITTFSLVDDITGDVYIKNLSPDSSFIKQASYENLEPELRDFINNKLKPAPGKTYLLINAMGASDYFGENLNADWFYEETLKKHHKSFEQYGHSFRHHVNKDPKIAEGRVIFSYYNDKMKRVELVTEVDTKKVDDILKRLEKGETVATSMACKVSKDICSICGNEAKRREDYCVHLKAYKRKIHTPSSPIPGAKKFGQKVYAENPDPKFFDISFVTIPADSTSSVLMKIAEAITGKEKTADIVKKDVARIDELDVIDIPKRRLPKKVLKKLAEHYTTPEIMTTMINMNMFPTKEDYQLIHMIGDGLGKEAELMDEIGMVFDIPSEPDKSILTKVASCNLSDSLANELLPYASDLGIGKPVVLARYMEKMSEVEEEVVPESKGHVVNTIPYLGGVGAAYYGYNKLLERAKKSKGLNFFAETETPPAVKHKLTKFLVDKPLLFAAGILGTGYALNKLQEKVLEKQSGFDPETANRLLLSSAIVAPAAFLYAASKRKAALNGEVLDGPDSFVANHPYASTALGTAALTPILKKLLVKRSSAEEYYSDLFLNSPEEFEQLYKETIK